MNSIIHVLYDVVLDKVVKLIGISLVLIILLQIGGRYLLTQPFAWTEEFSRLLFTWFAFLGSVITLRNKMHLGIEFIYQKFNDKSKKVIDTVIQLSIIFFGIILLVYGYELVQLGFVQKSPIMRWPMAYFYLSVPIAGFLFVVYGLYTLANLFKTNPNISKTEIENQ